MKTLLLTALLLNPLNTIEITKNDNQLTTTITFLDAERTDASNTYQYVETGDWETPYYYEIEQEWHTQTTANDYLDIKINNYCNMYGAVHVQDNEQYYTLDTFVIMQITPYRNTNDNDALINFNFDVDDIYADLGQYTERYQMTYEFYRTQTNLSSLVNTNTWANYDAVLNYKSIAIDNNENKYLLANLPLQTEQYPHDKTINLENIPIPQSQTTYIVGWVSLRVYRTGQNNVNDIDPPTEDTLLYHTDYAIITTTLAPVLEVYEVVDIPGLMFNILGLPFSFISQAFNLTIFPGTPYQVNISNLFLGFIATALLLWVLKLILGRADLSGWIADQKANHRQAKLENRRHKDAVELQTLKHNNKVSEQRMKESERHVRAAHKDGKS